MSDYLLIVKDNPTYYDWYTGRINISKYNLFLLHPGKPFKGTGFEIAPDHQKMIIRPTESLDGSLNLWQPCGNGKVTCHCPDEETEVDVTTVESLSVRFTDGEFIRYDFRQARFSDFLIFTLFKLGIFVMLEH